MEVDSPKERTILEYAWKSSIDPSSVTDGDIEKLREVGLSDAEIVEVQEIISIALGFNTFYDSLIAESPPESKEPE